MRFSLLSLLLPLVAAAAPKLNSNAITAPIAGALLTAGKPYTITWTNVQGPKVTLSLIDGPSNQLTSIADIATNVDNTGSFTWNVPKDIARSGTYSIRISYSENPAEWNYSDRFNLESTVVAPTNVKDASSSAAASTEASSSGSAPATSEDAASTSMSDATMAKSTSAAAATTPAAKSSGTAGTSVVTQTTRRSTYSVVPTNMAPLDGEDKSGAVRTEIAVSVIGVAVVMFVGGALL
ncbi:hypothetical protein TWF696_005494 [Orbilia brochopaga]|uniref:Yeast cell wall synthesis Kre9/Knh1-like N-terminal domain-containing protein n=1 Tax=Orbilia brochopaga TaxID=3140254 RepID=A0AAV9V0Z9_9PEZI